VNNILRRNGLLDPERRQARDWQRFEAKAPNRLWQMDFKGPIATQAGPCYALTVLDDHSRYNLCLGICPDQRRETVQTQLTQAFQRYGLPDCLLSDNGPPWGSGYAGQPFTKLAAWLIRHGVAVSHGRPYHPQTQGKDERFHLTLSLELLKPRPVWHEPVELAVAAQAWRDEYNHRRPHEALGNEPPASRYTPSPRAYCELLQPIDYPPADLKRIVQQQGSISFRGREYLVSRAFAGEPVALRAIADGVWDVYYCFQRVSHIDLTVPQV
jgi:transposase InsO family protein